MKKLGLRLTSELFNHEVRHKAGSTIRGQIYLEILKKRGVKVHGKKLVLYLKGFEDTEFGEIVKECGRAPIINMDFPIAEWQNEDFVIQPGQYAFPFEIELPDWLPASIGVVENKDAIMMQIKYMLVV